MKTPLAWFSPLPPQQTDVANYTERLRPHLDAQFDVRYFSDTETGFLCATSGKRYDCDPGAIPYPIVRELNTAGTPIYHIGNNREFHMNTWFLSRAKPGIVVLHDRKLHHFIDAIYKHRLGDRRGYLQLMYQFYGEAGLEAAVEAWEGTMSIEVMADQFPFTELAVEEALAVLVHTRNTLETVRRLTSTPVFYLPLPYESHQDHGAAASARESAGNKRIVIFGFLGPNRRIVEFLTALAELPERPHFIVEIFGNLVPGFDLAPAIEQLGLQNTVKIRGYVDEPLLDQALANAHLAVNLRWPSLGEASGTQLRIWDHGLPSLVTKTDAYADFPREAVCFVRTDHEKTDIQVHLRELLADPAAFAEKGRVGKRTLQREHAPADYVGALHEIIAQTEDLRRRHTAFQLATSVGRNVASLLPAESQPQLSARYGEVIAELLGSTV